MKEERMSTKRLIKKSDVSKSLEILEEMHPEAACALEHRDPFELIVAVVLSAQTTDVSVNKVTPELFRRFPDAASLAKADPDEVMEIIRTIGLYRNKSRNIVRLADKLVSDYDGQVPHDFNTLVSLPGVGRKTANVVLAEGFGVPRIAVDTHVFRVSNRIGLTDEKDVDATEESLMKRIPEDCWIKAHHLLIFHGRKVCSARKPACSKCGLNEICRHNNL
jgi:endonuclease-3